MSTAAPVQATFSYYNPPPNDVIAVNDWDCVLGLDPARHKQATLSVHDCRGHESDFTLDTDGFCFRTLDTSVDIETNEAGYLEEVKPLLKEQFPTASEFLFFPIMIRSEPRMNMERFKDTASYFSSLKPGRHPPISNTHIDWTATGMPGIYEGAVDKEGGQRLRQSGKRLLGVSLWKPLAKVQRDPLAVMKATSFDPAKECRVVPRTTAEGTPYENRVVVYSEKVPQHEWCWLSNQMPNEMTIIKLADTHPPAGVAECCPHTSFELPDADGSHGPRQSCELRCIVVF
ncbi:hypothetical protein BP6252_13898 [Coleophoma cylindrospora]|uniref:Uncharacterized protein n=1 Tax=Coleophoma cylindrospora TaxID=1849047 RepID=A0A3D8Q5D1_9HELO|nr:hypothetical protein BP6252_13898 [Coleophoma cylindrospora]